MFKVSTFKRAALAVCVLSVSACTPEEVQLYRSVVGDGPSSAEEATAICDPVFGEGSSEPGGECYQAAVDAVVDALVADASKPAVRLDPQPAIESGELAFPATPADGYQAFPTCKEAVDYLFAGRWDFDRVHMVVYRESRYDPSAVSPTGAKGCAQLTSGIRNAFLEGPWDDPYWNVLAMRNAVDHPDWGWCHWDIVNYCRSGGQF